MTVRETKQRQEKMKQNNWVLQQSLTIKGKTLLRIYHGDVREHLEARDGGRIIIGIVLVHGVILETPVHEEWLR
jgi:hypothetical protein